MRLRYVLGKVDYWNKGRKNCEAALEWSLEDGRFSMMGEIWNPGHTDIYLGGQCVDEVVAYFPGNQKANRMAEIWRRWHLNDMQAGCEHQRAQKENPVINEKCAVCGYHYGSAWLMEELPAEVVAEINSWSKL